MYPQQPQYPAQPAYAPPQYPPQPQQPQYPPQPQQPQYPPQPQQPQYPAQPTYAPQYPAQPTAPPPYPQAPAVPAQPAAQGTLDAFYSQPGGRGKAWSFQDKPLGTTYAGIVARALTNADIEQQTDRNTGAPRTFRDGRPMFVMIVPMHVQPSPEFPEGQAAWYVRHQARDELVRAMAEAGAPEGPPEAGAVVSVTLTGKRPGRPGFNPSHLYRVVYQRPQGAPPAPVQPSAPPAYTPPQGAPPAPVQPSAPPAQAPPQGAPPAPVQPAPVAAPQGMPALSPEQQALLARLTGVQG